MPQGSAPVLSRSMQQCCTQVSEVSSSLPSPPAPPTRSSRLSATALSSIFSSESACCTDSSDSARLGNGLCSGCSHGLKCGWCFCFHSGYLTHALYIFFMACRPNARSVRGGPAGPGTSHAPPAPPASQLLWVSQPGPLSPDPHPSVHP